MKIPLSGRVGAGLYAEIDDEDFHLVSDRSWHAGVDGPRIYAQAARGVGQRGIITMHQAILGRAPSGFVWDHIDGNRLNNRRSNLRLVTVSENAANAKLSTRNKTGVKGVSLARKNGRTCYACQVTFRGVTRKTAFVKLEDAIVWVTMTREDMHGEFANHG